MPEVPEVWLQLSPSSVFPSALCCAWARMEVTTHQTEESTRNQQGSSPCYARTLCSSAQHRLMALACGTLGAPKAAHRAMANWLGLESGNLQHYQVGAGWACFGLTDAVGYSSRAFVLDSGLQPVKGTPAEPK